MEEQVLKIENYSSSKFFQIHEITRYTNDTNDGRHVLLEVPDKKAYHLYFVPHGSLTIKNGSENYCLNEFGLVIYQPEDNQELTSLYMTSYVHCVFSGICIDDILEELQLKTNTVYHITPNYKSGEKFWFYNKQIEYVLKEFKKQKKCSVLTSSCMLIEFLSLYSRRLDEKIDDPNLKQIIQAIAYIIENSHLPIDIAELIQNTHLSKSCFYKHFKEYTGMSPLQFQQNCLFTAAADYLILYNMKVSDVSKRLGFSDPFYFSRLFKKNFGVSPKNYVKLHQNNSHIKDNYI